MRSSRSPLICGITIPVHARTINTLFIGAAYVHLFRGITSIARIKEGDQGVLVDTPNMMTRPRSSAGRRADIIHADCYEY